MDRKYTFSTEPDGYAKKEVDECIASYEAQLHEKTRMLRETLQRLDETRQMLAHALPGLYDSLAAQSEGDLDEDDGEEAAASL